MSLTGQQQDAVYRREVSVVLASGAGCGKTYVLTQRYLSHLIRDGAEVNQIVAITFTDRAARQMRSRIRRAIVESLTKAQEDEEIARWEQHLRGLETAQISTIHAFCANLLRQHAIEAGLDPHFDVLEDFLAINLETEALTDSLQNLLTAETTAGEDLRELVLLYGWRPTVAAIRNLLQDHQPVPQEQWLAKSPAAVAERWSAMVREELLPKYVRYLTTANPKIARCLWLLRNTPCKGPKMMSNIATIHEQVPRLVQLENLAETLEQINNAARVNNTEKAKAWHSEEDYAQIKSALTNLRAELPKRMALFLEEPEHLETAIITGQRFLRVTAETARTYQQLKRRHGVVDFQDLLVRARDLLRDHAGVRERLQRRYRFLLIDELQDTDPVQMELVEYLMGAGLTSGKLFAVGDHSQSIYRFRGADVDLFQKLRRQMAFEGRLLLSLNFRSQPAILHFANALFGPLPGEEKSEQRSGLEAYHELQAHHPQLNPGPCIEFLWSLRDGENATEAREIEADWIARRIVRMIEQKEKLVVQRQGDVSTLRPVQAGDVVLLFRSMTNVEIYESALRKHGLDYYLVGGRAFFAQQEIYDLLHLLRALENPHDAVSLAGTLRSPFCCLSDEALFVLTRHPDGLWAGLHDARCHAKLPAEQRPRVERARMYLERWRALKNRLPIARLLGEILADSGFDAALQFEFLGDRKLANLWKLVDMARTFDRSGLFGLAEFIQRLRDLVQAQPREEQAATQPENADVVRLMTIHQAKGLEFPVVIIPDVAASVGAVRYPVAEWDAKLGCIVRPPADDPPPFSDYAERLWKASEDMADYHEGLRTFYVACTRAADYLILSSALPEGFSPKTPWMLNLGERFNLYTGECLVPGLEPEKIPAVRVVRELPEVSGKLQQKQANPPKLRKENAERLLAETVNSHSKEVLDSASYPQWDAEDGSDRCFWLPPPGNAT